MHFASMRRMRRVLTLSLEWWRTIRPQRLTSSPAVASMPLKGTSPTLSFLQCFSAFFIPSVRAESIASKPHVVPSVVLLRLDAKRLILDCSRWCQQYSSNRLLYWVQMPSLLQRRPQVDGRAMGREVPPIKLAWDISRRMPR